MYDPAYTVTGAVNQSLSKGRDSTNARVMLRYCHASAEGSVDVSNSKTIV
jgi:hypothetical protein